MPRMSQLARNTRMDFNKKLGPKPKVTKAWKLIQGGASEAPPWLIYHLYNSHWEKWPLVSPESVQEFSHQK